ncbi:MAG: peptide-methionine (S)-S-oxide reductase MsrA [Pyrinomonadaceae bacterium]
MKTHILFLLLTIVVAGLLSCGSVSSSGDGTGHESLAIENGPTPDPAKLRTAVFAGGCFWGVEAVFEHTSGVADAKSGYAGGTETLAKYDEVSGGETGHAEAVQVNFDPEKVSYEQLLEIFFKVIHDPTQLNRQGPDIGPQYRSAIFFADDEQKKAAEAFIAKLGEAKVYSDPIVTQVVPLEKFFDAEKYHQDYLRKNPKDPYIVYHDLPKLEALKKQYPAFYVAK